MKLSERGLGAALAGIRRLAGMDVIDRLGLRDNVEKLVHGATKNGFSGAAAASRTFGKAQKALPGAKRQTPRKSAQLFDITPDDEQQMLVEAFRAFGTEVLRPGALDADTTSETPEKVLAQARELGTMLLGVPTELGGVVDERSSVTAVLAMEALAHGDLGQAAAVFAPASVATALGLHADADQQGQYLPALLDEQPPAAALAIAEARALFDPFELQTRARRTDDGYVLDGRKSLVPLAATAELFLVGADLEGVGPVLFIVESSTTGLTIAPEPTLGARAAAMGHLNLESVTLGADALLGGDQAGDAYADVVTRSRLAWCALAIGAGQAALDYVIPYVNEREAFGEPVSHRQGVAFIVSDIAVELEGMRLATYRAAALADQGKPFTQAVAIARQLCLTHGNTIGNDALQLLGGHGYVKEHPVERWYRDMRTAGMMEGAVLA